jgi:hypothetical protein
MESHGDTANVVNELRGNPKSGHHTKKKRRRNYVSLED